uniref:Three-Cys-motif partner protein TcmP n=1 Tax=Steinernema glaseri TaxID=37863 RepID=A0A1I7ZL61_9BILA
MDTVPRLFMERVCFYLGHRARNESCNIPAPWGGICSATRRKIYTLLIAVDKHKSNFWVAARPVLPEKEKYVKAVPLDGVDLKFLRNFQPVLPEKEKYIKLVPLDDVDLKFLRNFQLGTLYNLTSSFKEITLEALQKLVRFIKPAKKEAHPVRYEQESSNHFWLLSDTSHTIKKLLSTRLPVDSIYLSTYIGYVPELQEFFEHVGPLYKVDIIDFSHTFRKSMIDVMIDKYYPVDGGSFSFNMPLTRNQLERLVLKCEMSDKKVKLTVRSEEGKELRPSDDITKMFDFDKYYTNRRVERGELIAVREGGKLALRARCNALKQLYWTLEAIKKRSFPERLAP